MKRTCTLVLDGPDKSGACVDLYVHYDPPLLDTAADDAEAAEDNNAVVMSQHVLADVVLSGILASASFNRLPKPCSASRRRCEIVMVAEDQHDDDEMTDETDTVSLTVTFMPSALPPGHGIENSAIAYVGTIMRTLCEFPALVKLTVHGMPEGTRSETYDNRNAQFDDEDDEDDQDEDDDDVVFFDLTEKPDPRDIVIPDDVIKPDQRE